MSEEQRLVSEKLIKEQRVTITSLDIQIHFHTTIWILHFIHTTACSTVACEPALTNLYPQQSKIACSLQYSSQIVWNSLFFAHVNMPPPEINALQLAPQYKTYDCFGLHQVVAF
jgi:hypothetical protein